jgi:alpha-beta hydrolase superfamily lysophospholipase
MSAGTVTVKDWTIPGAEGEAIRGNVHVPATPRGVVLVAHGFKGYKDYGMFPRIAESLAEADFVAHRFNFSHSGMTNNIETFERPDLFEHDTWNKQVHDLRAVIGAVADGTLDGKGLPYVVFGHSRGGATALLTVGRYAGDLSLPAPSGVATAAAPSRLNFLGADQAEELLSKGFLVSPSSRTKQDLRIGRAFLQEQRDDPEGHDLPTVASRITCPILIVHGQADPSVPAICAQHLANAIGERAEVLMIPGADHVFKTPNPMPADSQPSRELATLLDALRSFAERVCA